MTHCSTSHSPSFFHSDSLQFCFTFFSVRYISCTLNIYSPFQRDPFKSFTFLLANFVGCFYHEHFCFCCCCYCFILFFGICTVVFWALLFSDKEIRYDYEEKEIKKRRGATTQNKWLNNAQLISLMHVYLHTFVIIFIGIFLSFRQRNKTTKLNKVSELCLVIFHFEILLMNTSRRCHATAQFLHCLSSNCRDIARLIQIQIYFFFVHFTCMNNYSCRVSHFFL